MKRSHALQIKALPGISLVQRGDDLVDMILVAAERAGEPLLDGDVLVLAQKIVSKSEGRTVRLDDVVVSERARQLALEVNKDPRLVELILGESTEVVRYRTDVLIVEHRLGFVMANAGIDMSNVRQGDVDDTALLLPLDPDATCAKLCQAIKSRRGVHVGVVINDSHGRAWRNGTVGVAIGVAGMAGLLDLRGAPDLFGRQLQTTQVGVADEIASAASLLMGQAAEGSPVILIRGLGHLLDDAHEHDARELIRDKQLDLFR